MKATTKWYLKGIAYVILIAIVIGLMTMLSSCQQEKLGEAGLPINTERHSVEEIMQMALNSQPETVEANLSAYELTEVLDAGGCKVFLEMNIGNWFNFGPLTMLYNNGIVADGFTYSNNSTGEYVTIYLDMTIQEIVEDYGADAYTGYLFQDYEDPNVFYIAGGWINGNDIDFNLPDDYYITGSNNIYTDSNNGTDDRPPDIDSIWEVTSDPIPVSAINENKQRFIRDYNGQYITMYGPVVFIDEEEFWLYDSEYVFVFPRYPDVIYDLNKYDTVGVYGKLDCDSRGTFDIVDAQVFISDFADF